MFEQFKSATIDSDRQKYLLALAASEDKDILTNLLGRTLNLTDDFRLQDIAYIFGTVSKNKVGRQVAMDWMTNNYDQIAESLGMIGLDQVGFARFAALLIDGM